MSIINGMINARTSVEGVNSQLGRKFLSDAITNRYGFWTIGAGLFTINYDNLPPEPGVLARLSNTNIPGPGYGRMTFNLNGITYLRGFRLEYWIRGGTPPASVRTYAEALGSNAIYDAAPFAATNIWVKHTFDIPRQLAGRTPWWVNFIDTRAVRVYFETWNAVGFDFEVAGVNIRRL